MKSVSLCAVALALVMSGCSSFNRDWRMEAKRPPSLDRLEGRWSGTWKSDASAHGDRLRCLLTRLSDTQYEARFHAKYKKILSFGYTAKFHGEKTNDVYSFVGDADLRKLAGGVYHYEGTISQTNFFCRYRSKYDHGTFTLSRPPG